MNRKILSAILATVMVLGMANAAFAVNEMKPADMPSDIATVGSGFQNNNLNERLPSGAIADATEFTNAFGGAEQTLVQNKAALAGTVVTDPITGSGNVLKISARYAQGFWMPSDTEKATTYGQKVTIDTIEYDGYEIKGYETNASLTAEIDCYVVKNGAYKKWYKIADTSVSGTYFFGDAPVCLGNNDMVNISMGVESRIATSGTVFYGFRFLGLPEEGATWNGLANRFRISLPQMAGDLHKNYDTGQGVEPGYLMLVENGIMTFPFFKVYTKADLSEKVQSAASGSYLADEPGVYSDTTKLSPINLGDKQWHDIMVMISRDLKLCRLYIDGKVVVTKHTTNIPDGKTIYTSEFVYFDNFATPQNPSIAIGTPRDAVLSGMNFYVDDITRKTSAAVVTKNKDIIITDTKLANTDGNDAFTGAAVEVDFDAPTVVNKIKWVFDTAEGRFYSATKDINYNVEAEGIVKFAAVTKNGTVEDGAIVGAKEITGIDAILKIGETNYFTNLVDANNMAE